MEDTVDAFVEPKEVAFRLSDTAPLYDILKTLSSVPLSSEKLGKDNGMKDPQKKTPSRARDSIDADKPLRRGIIRREKTIPINVTSIILTSFLGFLLLTCGYIFNDLKTSYFDLGKVKEDVKTLQGDVLSIKDTINLRFEESNKKLDKLIDLHTKN